MAGLWMGLRLGPKPQTALPQVRPPLAAMRQTLSQLWPRLALMIQLGVLLTPAGAELGEPVIGMVSIGDDAEVTAMVTATDTGGRAQSHIWCLVMPLRQQQLQEVVASRGPSLAW